MEMRKKSWDVRLILRRVAAAFLVDPLAKVICIMLSLILWMYVVGEAEVQFEFRDVPVEFVDLSPDLAISEDSQRQLSLRVRGPKNAISSLRPGDFRVLKSMTGKREGETWAAFSLENVASPRGDVKVESISPGSIRVFLERVEWRLLPVMPKLEGDVPVGFRLNVKARPDNVRVYGPASLFLRLSSVSTEVIDITGRRETFRTPARLKKELPSIHRFDPDQVEVVVGIDENLVEKVIQNIRVELQNPVQGRTALIKPESVTLRLRGPQNVVDRIDPQQIRVHVEFPPDKQFHLAVPRVVSLPERVEVVSYEPALVRVSIPGQ